MKIGCLLIFCSLAMISVAGSAPVRKSKHGVCHTPDSRYYQTLKHYKEFPNMAACVASGGRILRQRERVTRVLLTPTQ